MQKHSADVIVVGAGLAGIVTALELVKKQRHVILIDARPESDMGGLANWAFGGMALVGTPEQQSKKINDNQELALSDWLNYAKFDESEHWAKSWAEYYVDRCMPEVYEYVKSLGMKFLPAVNWAERSGNSVPRYHILWGCSLRLIQLLKEQLQHHSKYIDYHFEQKVLSLTTENNRITGCLTSDREYTAPSVVIATGGFGGSLTKVKAHWPPHWSPLKQSMLNGCHPQNDGLLAEHACSHGAQLRNMHNMWNYAAGIKHPQAQFPDQGLSLIPCRSALWVKPSGERIMPPIMGGFDTVELCHIINELQIPYSWQIMNRAIALKEFAISGSEHNPSIRDQNTFAFIRELLFGNRWLVDKMARESSEFILADDLDSLISQMQTHSENQELRKADLINALNNYDASLSRHDLTDPQVNQLLTLREYLPDRFRTLKPQSLLKKPPFIAIKCRLISRKSMGGLMTNLDSQVLDQQQNPIHGLYAVGEAAGFGGGGASGEKSLEGTFLSGCILTGRQAARSLL